MAIEVGTYQPTVHYAQTAGEYYFRFPIADEESLEVYEIASSGARTFVPRGKYTIQYGKVNERYPIRYNGTVIYKDHTPGTVFISIERNTLMKQVHDQSAFWPFNNRMVEFALDRATLICQELVHRKCDAVNSTDMTQLNIITAYDDFRAQTVNNSVKKLFDILLEIDETAESCADTPEET